jgi:hypothetical protein
MAVALERNVNFKSWMRAGVQVELVQEEEKPYKVKIIPLKLLFTYKRLALML